MILNNKKSLHNGITKVGSGKPDGEAWRPPLTEYQAKARQNGPLRSEMKTPKLLQQFLVLLSPFLIPTAKPSTAANSATLSLENIWPEVSHPCPEDCRCTVLPFDILANKTLRSVDCSTLGVEEVPRNIPTKAEALILTRNRLTDLYGQLSPLPQLQVLDISHNLIKQLGRGVIFHNFTELRVLNLSHNDFRTVFNGVFRGIPHLQYLFMTHVQIKFIEEHVFDGLHELKLLHLSQNHLSAIFPEWFKDLHQLRELHLEYNHIAYVNSATFASLRNLGKLCLSGNKIRGVSDQAFSGLENLTALLMDNNQLTKVPSPSFQATKNLKILKLGGNFFKQLRTRDFSHLRLEEVFIEDIAELTLVDRGSFWDLTHLKVLHLHHNPKLEYVDAQAFIDVPNLRILSLHSNNLSALSRDVMDGFKRSLQISLYENPLLCDCNVKWIQDTIKASKTNLSRVNILQSDLMLCDSPKEVRKILVKELQKSQVPEKCPPVLVGFMNNTVDKKIGDTHIFQCHAHGIPPAKIHWVLPNGSVLNQTSNDIHIHFKQPGSLTLYHLKPKDSGTYTCIAENNLGEAIGFTELTVDNIDINIFPLGVASTFVTVVWNGTARNAFPEYEIVYRQENNEKAQSENKSVTVSQYFRSYTINNLRPHSTYKFCIGRKNEEDDQYIQFSCTWVQTRDESFMLQGIHHTSNVAVAIVLAIVACMLVVVCLVTVAARKYRQRHYNTPEKSLVTHMAQIPLENLNSPLMSHVGH